MFRPVWNRIFTRRTAACSALVAALFFLTGQHIGAHTIGFTGTEQFAANAVTVNQATASSVTLTVQISMLPTSPTTVQYTTQDGTATAPDNYAAATGSLIFVPATTDNPNPPLTQTITIQLGPKNAPGATSSFTVVLSNALDPYVVGTNSTVTVTIINVPPPTVQFAKATLTVNESDGTAQIKVTLTGKAGVNYGPVTVKYSTADGTAKAETDYTGATDTITFAAGTVMVQPELENRDVRISD